MMLSVDCPQRSSIVWGGRVNCQMVADIEDGIILEQEMQIKTKTSGLLSCFRSAFVKDIEQGTYSTWFLEH